MSHEEIHRLLADYALALDADEIDQCLELFTEDAEFAAYGRTFSGHAGIGAMFRAAPGGLHLTGAVHVEERESDAVVRSQVLFFNPETLQHRPALYDDELVRRDGRWLFRRRRCRFVTSTGLRDAPEVPAS